MEKSTHITQLMLCKHSTNTLNMYMKKFDANKVIDHYCAGVSTKHFLLSLSSLPLQFFQILYLREQC